ncbi:MAG: hypothetical protein A3B91_02025 [Candidatus Yanofskybacteria bacterium RIFCSPHIGHO2_02_FULL_41_29]|uniref:Fructose-1,6-bisphosphatase n=1 Tax=Candidatus Yanofskybacteria bacterium RIFCSPHIGHO2_01_FULL_41_53 TaxID=1802663 RepID=A0A1F8EGP0_9BACT|nr:MAG: hypothetical protein A2650_01305 [Candidatus Yanofskybacteria bacterium RIFCSPHIGHO2_01_FULL_41_53]OGN10510.1 MAG: hypothetical protein A3B91_02025 [Candidatus Yanofskybacteria bacterium RIFCSPHIGHO2_02_FULL_41_29]OGN18907.1 MAG: hypothetical protein A3F48_02585 [Candidatus Yanofskybacteria bacterium RIFCSPHIGHO2_12_FULL_41_9]OGN21497.1 MAG: hypothetical protein A2916_01655 [Candidatus Yanofskybacteria bacterium RIFCSPLOWO2_01_FULL_41_67]OGN28471.1 MAG: hypothetical protein A3H54_04375 
MERNIAFELGRICERAALAVAPFVGRGDRHAADNAATQAMRQGFEDLKIRGTIVIGEGERDKAPMLYIGEEVGLSAERFYPEIIDEINPIYADFFEESKLKIAVDPLEGTNLVANGWPGAITVIAGVVEGEGDLLHAPDIYMEKIAVGEEARECIKLGRSVEETLKLVEENLNNIACALKKHVKELTVMVLERPRHNDLVARIREVGARIRFITDGDVAGALATAKPNSGIDCLMGIGAAPEGVLASAAMRALRGQILGRLVCIKDEDRERAKIMGVEDFDHIYTSEEMAQGDVMFAATGVTGGDFLKGVVYVPGGALTNTVLMRSKSNTIRWQEVWHRFDDPEKVYNE